MVCGCSIEQHTAKIMGAPEYLCHVLTLKIGLEIARTRKIKMQYMMKYYSRWIFDVIIHQMLNKYLRIESSKFS